MAKLRARGRQEIARLTRTSPTPDDKDVSEETSQVALMTDGNVLSRRVIRWRPGSSMMQYGGRPTHDYGWKVKGKIKAGLTAEDFVRIYQDRGYTLESSSAEYLTRRGNTIENASPEPIRSEAKAAREKRSKETRASKPKSHAPASKSTPYRHGHRIDIKGEGKGEGPGLYVTNGYVGSLRNLSGQQRAVAYGPFSDMELAELAAADRLNYLIDMKFDYLSPVEIVQAESLEQAEAGFGHCWWQNGFQKGPPVSPRQLRLFDRTYRG